MRARCFPLIGANRLARGEHLDERIQFVLARMTAALEHISRHEFLAEETADLYFGALVLGVAEDTFQTPDLLFAGEALNVEAAALVLNVLLKVFKKYIVRVCLRFLALVKYLDLPEHLA